MWDLIVSVPDHCLSFYFTMDALSSQNLSIKLCKIQTVPGFAQNMNFSTFPILFFF